MPKPSKRIRRAQSHCVYRQHPITRAGIAFFKLQRKLEPSTTAKLSTIERLPQVVSQNIFNQIEGGASQICLALTSKTMLASSHPFSFDKTHIWYDDFGVQESISSPETDYPLDLCINGKIVDSWLRPISHLCLMAQLRDWIPKHLRFCWHCLYWLPIFNFPDSKYLELHDLPRLCMDCIPGHQTDRGQTLRGCDGCVARDKVADVKYTEQDEDDEEDEEWDFLAKLANWDS